MNHISKIAPFAGPVFAIFNFANAQGHHWGGRGWSLFEGLLQLLFLALFVVGIIFLVQALRSRRTFDLPGMKATAPTTQDSALQILRERLAKGEIDPEDYEARRRVLETTQKPPPV
jgi:putative membrane protein